MTYNDVVLADSPLIFYHLDESYAYAQMVDSSGNARHGNHQGSSVYQPGLVREQRFGKSIYVVANSSVSRASLGSALNTPKFTLEVWYKPAQVSNGYRAIVTQGDPASSSTSNAWALVQYGQYLYFFMWFGSNQYSVSAVCLAYQQTSHIMVTWSNDDLGDGSGQTMIRMYHNGTEVASANNWPSARNLPTNTPLVIGGTSSGNVNYYGYGWYDEVSFYGDALTPARVAAHYAGGLADPPPQEILSITRYHIGQGQVVDFEVIRQRKLALSVLYPNQTYAPTVLTVTLAGGNPDSPVNFAVDGHHIGTLTTDGNGGLAATSLIVPDLRDGAGQPRFGAGTHTLTATQVDAVAAEAEFILAEDPVQTPVPLGNDAPPVPVPSAVTPHGTRKWVLQDLAPGGLGSWVMPLSPESADPPPFQRDLQVKTTTALNGARHHIYEGAPMPIEWSFSGYLPNLELVEKLEQYGDLNRRFYLIDHRRRAGVVTFSEVNIEPRLVQYWDGEMTTEGHDYTVQAVIYGRTYVEVA